MARPKVVRETRREPEERAPPPGDAVTPHEWMSEESRHEYERRLRSGGPFDLYLSTESERQIRSQSCRQAPKRLEVMGFMLGDLGRWNGRTYATVRAVVTTDLKSSPSNVRFDRDALPKLFKDMDGSGFDYIIVGWYHSHPGHTCFLSNTDLETQRTMFDQPYHTALVIDPLNEEIKTFKLSGEGYCEVPFAIVSAPVSGRDGAVRTRRLKEAR